MTELLPCPFCGETDHVSEKEGKAYRYICLGCGASGPATHKLSEVLEAWNTRNTVSVDNEQVRQATNILKKVWPGAFLHPEHIRRVLGQRLESE